ncbi:hypothetical protein DBV23_17135 [Edwardsiella ictaluri]|uniref:Uncharacterized protein n=2 Tax=Edwardsiella ictaluri TaxID=67780 RepID=C5BA51_EDWI9|nr:hypothetical protein [Edwardsiella ictaluri]ACR69172.2 hypothetical protein NT01EI_1996 [Edwardsiella ictaluri 93-146]AVZ83754.1 hypothetical protein DBV23_17135 [Edwardsiella ictaluri]EKS7764082.1 hypothetical protein [Edwardsiella ictaluri]EKS7770905.1 hypothetical protein [Edwardsiella ictaluri]EKS7774308.1 hypothetical protein [Edwardsiella ictaluri]
MTPALYHQIIRAAADDGGLSLLDDINRTCRQGMALCIGSDHVRIVLRLRLRDGVPYVVVWLAASTLPDGLRRYTPLVKMMIRQVGGHWAEFATRRRGFIRLARRLGFERLEDEGAFLRFKIPL